MKAQVSVPHTLRDPLIAERDPENPDGIYLNTGEVVPIGDVRDVAEECGVPFHELLIRYEEFYVDKFVESDWRAEGLFIFPEAYILFTTYFDEIMPSHAEYDVQLPYTVVMAFVRPAHRDIERIVARIAAGKP